MRYLCLGLSVVTLMFFVGCEQAPASVSQLQEEPPFPEVNEAVYTAAEALKTADYEELKKYLDLNDEELLSNMPFPIETESQESQQSQALLNTFFEDLTCNVISVEQVGENATAIVEFTTIDGAKCIDSFMLGMVEEFAAEMIISQKQPTQEELTTAFYDTATEILEDSNRPTTKETIEIDLVKGEEHWLIVPEVKIVDAVTGGLISKTESLYEQYSDFVPQEFSSMIPTF